MVVPAMICSVSLLILLAVLSVAERAYLRAHAIGAARDLAAAGMQVRESSPLEEAREAEALLAETLAQDLFHDPAQEGRRRVLGRRGDVVRPQRPAAGRPGAGAASTRREAGPAQ